MAYLSHFDDIRHQLRVGGDILRLETGVSLWSFVRRAARQCLDRGDLA
jgi:hypothetical protein